GRRVQPEAHPAVGRLQLLRGLIRPHRPPPVWAYADRMDVSVADRTVRRSSCRSGRKRDNDACPPTPTLPRCCRQVKVSAMPTDHRADAPKKASRTPSVTPRVSAMPSDHSEGGRTVALGDEALELRSPGRRAEALRLGGGGGGGGGVAWAGGGRGARSA